MITNSYLNTVITLYKKDLKNRLSWKKGHHYQPFLIVGLPRSGTTLLHTYLNNHPNLHSRGEVVLKDLVQKPENTFVPFGKHIQAAGAKVLLPEAPSETDFQLIKQAFISNPQIKIIFIQRENLLRRYTSLQIAYKTRQWSQTGKEAALSERQIIIDPKVLLKQLKETETNLFRYRNLLKEVSCMEISYEHLVQLPQQLLPDVQAYLGVKANPLISLLQRQNPEPLSSLVRNFDQLTEVLKNTPYSKYLNT